MKQKLIDANNIEYHKVWIETPIDGQHDGCIMVYKNQIDSLPIVEAIPVEWLLKKRDKNKKIAEKLGKEDLDIDFVAKYLYKRASREVLMIEELLLDWEMESKKQEKENATNR